MFRKSICAIVICLFSLVLFSETVVLNSTASAGVSFTVVDNADDYTILEVDINSYTREAFDIDGEKYYQIAMETSGVTLEKGFPSLPIIARSIVIGADSKMELEILKAEYTEFSGKIPPSKGSVYRDVNTADLAWTFNEIYSKDAFYPSEQVRLTDPYIMRELRGIAVQIYPVSANPVQETVRLYHKMIVKVHANGKDSHENVLPGPPTRITDSFVNIYRDHFINYDHIGTRYPDITQVGSMLVICYPDFTTAMQPFVDWKNQKGIPTTMMLSTTAGANGNAIKTFISNYYLSNPDVAYILLVGDSQQVPYITYSGGPSDPSYAMIAGNDYYPDLLVGRFSAQTISHVNIQVNKTIHYERDLDTTASWVPNATGIASNEGTSPGWGDNDESDEQHVVIIRNKLLNYGYETVDAIYQSHGSNATMVSNAVNAGRSYINYTGHGDTDHWVSPLYYNSHVAQLNNSNMLPFIISVACNNGRFHVAQECFAEAWMRASNNSTGASTGAVATFMCSILQAWDPPMRTQDKVVDLLTAGEKNSIGGLVYNGQSGMLDVYNNSNGREVMMTWILFGDPSLMIRSRVPQELEIEVPGALPFGTETFTVGAGEENALVCVYRADFNEIVDCGYTDETGFVTLDVSSVANDDCPLLLTITAFDRVTYENELIRGELPPGQVILLSPEDNATEVPITPELQWMRPSGGIAGYRVYLSEEEMPYDSSNPQRNLYAVVDDTPNMPVEVYYTITEEQALECETIYYWQVIAFNEAGDGVASLVFCFTTAEPISDYDMAVKPSVTALKANYPNPFNPTTYIAFDLNKDSNVSISVYDIRGRFVVNLVDSFYKSGHHNVAWNGVDSSGKGVASGVYFYRMNAGDYQSVRKMVMVK